MKSRGGSRAGGVLFRDAMQNEDTTVIECVEAHYVAAVGVQKRKRQRKLKIEV